MIIFFTNRELAAKLDINLARWKRWSRDFLPPDPLGGMQSGYARQYNPDDAFTVYLGGHLVSEIKFTIPQAKQIIADLHKWFKENGFLYDIKGNAVAKSGIDALIKRYLILIRRPNQDVEKSFEFYYTIRGVISRKPTQYKGFEIMEERYAEAVIGLQPGVSEDPYSETVKTLNITAVLNTFVTRLDLDRSHYPTLNPHFS